MRLRICGYIVHALKIKTNIKTLAMLVGFGEFEESSPRDGVAVSVDHQITISHHGQVFTCEQH